MISSFVTDLKWVLLEFLFLFTEKMHTLIRGFGILIEYQQYNQAAVIRCQEICCTGCQILAMFCAGRGDVRVLSCVQLFVAPWTVGCQAPLSMEFVDCNLPGSSVHGIFQAKTLEWFAISFSRESSWPRDWTCVSCIGRWVLYHWATRETLGSRVD